MRRAPYSPSAQRGIALVTVLLLLIVVTLIGLAAMRGTLLQERMAGNVAARGTAFQTAEAALREAESVAATRPAAPSSGCSAGICSIPNPAVEPPWLTSGFWSTDGNYRVATGEAGGSVLRYVIEDMGLGNPTSCTTAIDVSAGSTCAATAQNYRITVLSQLDNGTEVILQSMYQVE